MPAQLENHLQQLTQQVPAATPEQARQAQQQGAVLVDVREPNEWLGGVPEGALCLSRGVLESKLPKHAPEVDTPIYVMCQSGRRGTLATAAMQAIGYTQVHNVAGGYIAWQQAGLPTSTPTLPNPSDALRYQRHISLPEVGLQGQQLLRQASVLLIGLGGIGSPAALYLAAAGIGTLGLVDDDSVELSNLQRQIIHTEASLGIAKTASAQRGIQAINSGVTVRTHPQRLTADNAAALLVPYDLIIDGSDNFATRYLINDAAMAQKKTLIQGSVHQFEGQLAVFSQATNRQAPCYRCLFPEEHQNTDAPSCAQAGVLGAVPGVIGTLCAIEAIKVLLGIGQSLSSQLLCYSALSGIFSTQQLTASPTCRCQR